MHRTTIDLDEALYREVKRKAVDRGRPMRVLVEEALRGYLGFIQRPSKLQRPTFGVYHARVVGSLRRENIYEGYLARKTR